MRFRKRSQLRRTRKRSHRQKITYTGGAFDAIGTIRVTTNPQKRLIISFDDNIEFPNDNIRMYIRESLTDVKKRDFRSGNLPHNYLDVPISDCSHSDIIKIKFLYVQWAKSLPDGIKAPEFRWSSEFDKQWGKITPSDKKSELAKLQASFAAADYAPLYTELLMRYEDPFGGVFDLLPEKPSLAAAAAAPFKKANKPKHHNNIADTALLERMDRANAELEQTQARLHTRRRQQAPKHTETRMQKIWSAIGRVTKPKPYN
jgi:hypothetical protein